MYSRRKFLKVSAASASLAAISNSILAKPILKSEPTGFPIVISTWNFGIQANQEAWKTLSTGGRALDAVEAGVRIPEADMKNHTVGRAGYPDRDGHVTLDACIMDELGNLISCCNGIHSAPNICSPFGDGKNTAHYVSRRRCYTIRR